MTLYRATVYKRVTGPVFNGEQWSNVYTIDEGNALEAIGVAQSAALLEAEHMLDIAEVYRITVVDPNAPNDKRVASVDYQGQRTAVGVGSVLPMFNTVRVIFSDDVERPESKYLRGILAADNVEAGQVGDELRTEIQAGYVAGILALNPIVGPSGETLTTGSVQPAVQMRQLGWSRRTRPGFKRGWVPV